MRLSGRRLLLAPTTIYVDNQPGLVSRMLGGLMRKGTLRNPFRSINDASYEVSENIDFNGYPVTIQLADGVHRLNRPLRVDNYGDLSLVGNTSDPFKVVIQHDDDYHGVLLEARNHSILTVGNIEGRLHPYWS